jgi:hypothetical protein
MLTMVVSTKKPVFVNILIQLFGLSQNTNTKTRACIILPTVPLNEEHGGTCEKDQIPWVHRCRLFQSGNVVQIEKRNRHRERYEGKKNMRERKYEEFKM